MGIDNKKCAVMCLRSNTKVIIVKQQDFENEKLEQSFSDTSDDYVKRILCRLLSLQNENILVQLTKTSNM